MSCRLGSFWKTSLFILIAPLNSREPVRRSLISTSYTYTLRYGCLRPSTAVECLTYFLAVSHDLGLLSPLVPCSFRQILPMFCELETVEKQACRSRLQLKCRVRPWYFHVFRCLVSML
ncbi:hypothetical protein MAPG_00414 [Magnaporthiopsis poae ATCC 64411]|uniref:Secreted protein n=1 Tax=Magnaporthiopsis poae (strain ATCC 64411 / 73-15) TaxID=644358 RepID=A0A0C4DKY2_MAGP6|nr:hypothetical protein MAPG_00414 [Magnaporthiopsis poae ATCC 64411]